MQITVMKYLWCLYLDICVCYVKAPFHHFVQVDVTLIKLFLKKKLKK